MNERSSRDYSSDRGPRQGGRGPQDRSGSGRGSYRPENERRDREQGRDRGYRSGDRYDRGQRGDGGTRGDREQNRDGGYRGDRNRGDFRSDRPRKQYGRDDRQRPASEGREDRGARRPYESRDDRPRKNTGAGREGRAGSGERTGGLRKPYANRNDRSAGRGAGDRDERPGKRYDDRADGAQRRGFGGRDDRERRPYSGRDDRAGRGERDDRPRRSSGDRYERDGGRGSYGDRRGSDDRGSGGRQQRDERGSNGRGSYDRRSNDRGAQDRGPQGRGGTRGGGRSDRGGAGRTFTEAERLQHELRPVRSEHQDPWIPEEIEPKDLYPAARNELKTLQTDVQERVARHLATALMLLDEDPALAHEHALSASRRAGRIPVAREFLAMTAYRTGDFALALRELRTYRRLSGRDNHVALMVECERGLARPEKAVETGLEIDASKLETEQRVHLAIAMSGARLDLGQTQQALFELEIPELNPDRGFSWSPELFAAYAAVLEELGRADEAAVWTEHALRAERALEQHFGGSDEIDVIEIVEYESATESEDGGGSDAPEPSEKAEGASGSAEPAEAVASEAGADEAPAEGAETVATAPDTLAEPAGAPVTGAATPPEGDTAEEPRSFDAAIAAEVDELLAEAGITDDGSDDGRTDTEEGKAD